LLDQGTLRTTLPSFRPSWLSSSAWGFSMFALGAG